MPFRTDSVIKYIAISILLISFFHILVSCDTKAHKSEEKNSEKPAARVNVAKVSLKPAPNQIEVVGTVRAVDQAEISSKISGNITLLSVALGSRINKGDLLVEISAGEISAQVQQADAQLVQAKRNLVREEKLLRKNAATSESVKSLRDTVRIAEASHRKAQTMLSYTRIIAPFSGIVTHKIASTGDLATPGKPLLRIEKENKLQIVTDVPEAIIHKIKKGDRLPAYIPAIDHHFLGEVTELSPIADPSSRTSPIKLKIVSAPNLRSGQFARVTFAFDNTHTLTVPVEAVTQFGQMERVFIVGEKKKAKMRLVRTGATIKVTGEPDYFEILSGLSENELVVVGKNPSVENGQPLIFD